MFFVNSQIFSDNVLRNAPRKRVSLALIAYDVILEAIVERQLAPGARVNMDGLASQLEMSNTPVREALVRLTATGLVEQISNRGFVVSPMLSVQAYNHLFDTRCLLETEALRTAHFTETSLATLDALAQKIANMEYGTSYKHFIGNLQADESFHLGLVTASGNRFLVSAWESLNFYSHVSRLHTEVEALDNDSYKQSLRDHLTIVQQVRSGCRDDAVGTLRAHIRNVQTRLMASAQKLSERDDQ